MFLQVKTAAAAAVIAISASPASSAILDIYATASVTEMVRSGFFETGFDPSNYSYTFPEVEADIFESFGDANVGDTVSIHWELDTESGAPFNDLDPGDKSIDELYGYPGGPISATFSVKGTSWRVGSSEGSRAWYIDTPEKFSLSYHSADNADDYLGGYPSGSNHNTLINTRPEDYVTSKGLLNTFQHSGHNLGFGHLEIFSEMTTFIDTEDEYSDDDVFSYLKLNYQITSIRASLQGVEIASTPLPAGALLLASGLFGFGLLRRRKA